MMDYDIRAEAVEAAIAVDARPRVADGLAAASARAGSPSA